MKSFFQRRRGYAGRGLKRDFRAIWRDTTAFLNRYRWHCLGIVLVVLATAFLLSQTRDHAWLKELKADRKSPLRPWAEAISYWGDFAQYNLGLAALIWATGYVRRSRWLQRLAVATVIAATLAGLTCNVFRFSLSRPRPRANAEDGLYGFRGTVQGWNYHSFPSGHTATAFGTSTPLLVAGGPAGAVVTLFSSSVAWSRLSLQQHFPSDVLVGAMLGLIYGTAASSRLPALRRRSRYVAQKESTPPGLTAESSSRA